MDVVSLLRGADLTLFLLVAVRTMTAMAVGPLAAWPGVPLPARIFIGLGIALALAPSVPTMVPLSQIHAGPLELVQELVIGLVFGLASMLLVSALQLAAGMMDYQAGFTFGTSLDPLAGHPAGPIERFLGAFAAVLFLDLNGHHLFLLALGELFQIAPVGGPLQLADAGRIATFFSAIVAAALAMALPLVTVLILVDVALAVISRAAPAFNLFAVGLPAKSGIALVVLALLLPVTASQLQHLFGHLPDVLTVVIRH
jgi:flagellar biosynthetic protein FliR